VGVFWAKLKSLHNDRRGRRLLIAAGCLLLLAYAIFAFRFDYQGGSHKIYPTAVDNDFWGNFKVYYRTNPLTKEEDEKIYYIARGRRDVRDKVRQAIVENKPIVAHYDRYIGIKGIFAPKESPIVRVDIIDEPRSGVGEYILRLIQ